MATNIQAAAEAREVQWRTDTDKARKIREELLEDHNLSSKGKIEEISKGWHTTKEKMIPQEVQAALIYQQQQCADLIKDKKQIMDTIQQDLKARDDSFVADLRKQTEELQLMLERMEEQDRTLTEAYREKLEQWKENVQKEEETKHTEIKTAWEMCMKNLLETEVDKLFKRQQAVEEYEAQIHHLMFETSDNFNIIRNREFADFQTLELEIHQVESERIFIEQKIENQKADGIKLKAEDTQMKAKLSGLKSELVKLRLDKQSGKGRREKQLMEKKLKELNYKAQDYERIQKKIIHFAIADAIKFENMWLTVDAEVKELLERALYVDSMIYENVFHIPWEQLNLSFAEPGRRWEERCAVSQTSQYSQVNGMIEGLYNDSESEAEVGNISEERSSVATPRTVKRLVEILCDEAGFLFEVKIVKLLDTLDENERNLIKMGYLFDTLGIKEGDVPKLVDFLFKYAQQCPRESELQNIEAAQPSSSTDEVQTSSLAPVTSDPVDRNDVLQALKCFLDHYKLGSGTKNTDKWSVQSLEAWDMSKEEAYWESLGNAITTDKLKIWAVTEKKLQQHHTVLSEISELSQEIKSLQQENTELQMVCMLLQQVCLGQPLDFSPHVTQLDME
ncbi:dynein regulatory complex protein 1-like [Boleophthalmus pectinirostris]|uniref:dynein regulatory complex protein 1-like n=1 Tax=Boleophthalmus pectinirostris TaxID=150288 RepID=UPI00242ED150|nr:dynein regulatory complex protein 1-like [Boleophthalmus pectinirostris]